MQDDTPAAVSTPDSYLGFMVWAVARFGVGVLFASVFGYFLMQVYRDMRSDNQQVLEAFQMQSTREAETVGALKQLTIAVERLASIQTQTENNHRDILQLQQQQVRK